MDRQNIKERREHPRYFTNADTFVNASKNFGRIVDISLGGMKFHYLNWDESTELEGRLDVYLDGVDVLTNIPFQVLPDPEKESQESEQAAILKQCRIKFKKLSAAQLTKLEHFLLNNTAGLA